MQRHWYAVHTYSGHENKVMNNITSRAKSMGLADKIFRVLVPTEAELRTRAGKKTEHKRKVFPGYVLIDMVLDPTTWHLVKSTTGVTGFVTSGDKAIPLQESEVQQILEAVEGNKPTPVVRFEKNEVVRVISGPFTEFTGKIEEVNADKEKLKVLISIFGRDTPVELDFQQVEKIV
ncbi:MAG: transcription termination/antitermination factor NusG [Armatimonadetes bacterium]|nr:transcription termination/antitermination factor NusG [Armatimonadota bacterium]MDE2207355.1 transcription termination/antitermination factor NusG [Armatimonadota bacterium]